MSRHRLNIGIALLLSATCAAGCIHPVRTAGKVAVKTTTTVAKGTVKVVTWPVRAVSGHHKDKAAQLADLETKPVDPEPIVTGSLPGEDETAVR